MARLFFISWRRSEQGTLREALSVRAVSVARRTIRARANKTGDAVVQMVASEPATELALVRPNHEPRLRSISAHLVSSGTMMVPYGASRYVNAYHWIGRRSVDPAGKAIVNIAAPIALSNLLPSLLLLRLR